MLCPFSDTGRECRPPFLSQAQYFKEQIRIIKPILPPNNAIKSDLPRANYAVLAAAYRGRYSATRIFAASGGSERKGNLIDN
jgi:hypothetical protein